MEDGLATLGIGLTTAVNPHGLGINLSCTGLINEQKGIGGEAGKVLVLGKGSTQLHDIARVAKATGTDFGQFETTRARNGTDSGYTTLFC